MIALLPLAGTAWATTYSVDVCASIGIDFADVDGSNGDDYLVSNTSVPGRGVHVIVNRTSFPPAGVANFWARQSAPDAGCSPTAISLDSGATYTATIYSEALVNNETIEVYKDVPPFRVLTAYTSASFSPTSNAPWKVTTTGSYPDWNILAAGAYAVWRYDLGNGTDTFVAYSEACPGASGSCFTGAAVFIDPTYGYQYKYQIAHEFGHALLYERYGSSASDPSAYPTGTCEGDWDSTDGSGHQFISKEWQGTAFWEGFANYYATAAFNNDTTETDCAFGLYKAADWNRDNIDNESAQFIDCAGDPIIQDPGDTPSSFSIDGTNYTAAYCDNYANCSPTNANLGTEFDWVEFLWHLDAVEGRSPDEFADVYEEARTWAETHDGYATSGCGAGAGYPLYELRAATYRLSPGLGYDWDFHDATYGVDQ